MATSRTRARVTPDADTPAVDDEVTAIVPNAYTLTLDDSTQVRYLAGTQQMPRSHLEHWWSEKQGVKEYKGKKAQAEE